MKTSLYDISEKIVSILGSEEWDDSTMEELESLNLSLEAKAKNIVEFCANLESFAKSAKDEEKRIAARRKAAENRVERLKEYVKQNMESIDRTELDAGTANLKIQKNPPKAIVDNEKDIPAKYFVVIPASKSLDKKLLLDDLKKGDVEGAHIETGTHLRIR